MYGSGDVARGEYDNMEVEAIRGNFARKSHNKKSGIINANDSNDRIRFWQQMSMIKSVKFKYFKNILVLQGMYLGRKGNAEILIKNFFRL